MTSRGSSLVEWVAIRERAGGIRRGVVVVVVAGVLDLDLESALVLGEGRGRR